jgi:2-keto-3-deoxy-L-rhamnonate aldolase RhmA
MVERGNLGTGLFVKLPSTEIIDLIADSGVQFAVVDLEHSQLDAGDAARLVRHAKAIALPALVRIPELDRGLVNRLLEAGAAGIQLSMVRTVAQVRELRAATRYPPAGTRSFSLAHAQAAYGAIATAEYLDRQAADPPLVVAQIETAETDDPLDAIVAERPDVVFVGTADLAVDCGLDQERVRARVAEIGAAAARAGVTFGGFALDAPDVGYQVTSSDLALLRGALIDAA